MDALDKARLISISATILDGDVDMCLSSKPDIMLTEEYEQALISLAEYITARVAAICASSHEDAQQIARTMGAESAQQIDSEMEIGDIWK